MMERRRGRQGRRREKQRGGWGLMILRGEIERISCCISMGLGL